ncbi:TetR/AcrR family transcriptional regulator [Roseibium sp. HPY-6]|uniref:TetR/AcrR family transcriptional regulator n=1 Tax=Roseibium sp. HPY-6 TaxID=3229852 RepID=UPI00338EC658
MGRPQEFDEGKALTAASHIFRRYGYGGVSVKTLEAETGLSSGSLYNSFGNKDAVFARVLDHYNETVVKSRIRTHLANPNSLAGLISLFQSLLEEPNDGAFGCLLTNSAIEFAGQDTAARTAIDDGFAAFLTAFKATILAIQDVSEAQADGMSLRLLTYYQGLLVLIRHGHDKASLRATIKDEITAIIGVIDA